MTDQPAGAATSPLPLFYSRPEPLSADRHGSWRLRDGDAGFAAGTAFVPILAIEIAHAARDYPIVFAADGGAPIAVVGLEHANLFVADGQWDRDVYVPAYVRRYPFGFMATTDPDGFALAIDAASDRVVRDGDGGIALFDGGAPTGFTRQALEFCTAFNQDATVTQAFVSALRAQDLLTERRADASLPDGRRFGVQGFQIVDAEKLVALPDEVVVPWFRAGYLSLIAFHLASLERFQSLLARQADRQSRSTEKDTPA